MLSLAVMAVGAGALVGCQSGAIGGAAGAVAGTVSGAATANPIAGYAIGVSVQAAVDATVKYVLREWQDDQQNLMASVAGELPIGAVRNWEIRHAIPYGNERGQIQAVRDIDTPLARCRELLFTVAVEDAPSPSYVTHICLQDGEWRWASAEPAVARWNGLQ